MLNVKKINCKGQLRGAVSFCRFLYILKDKRSAFFCHIVVYQHLYHMLVGKKPQKYF